MPTWRGLTWERSMYGTPGSPSYVPTAFQDPYGRDPFGLDPRDLPAASLPAYVPPDPNVLPAAALPAPLTSEPVTGDQGFDVSRLAQDIAYGHSDWQKAGQAARGSGRFEDASGLRRAGAFVGGAALGTLALASWIPGFNVFKPAQAARAARAFGQGAATGARTGTGIVRGGFEEASDLEKARRAQKAADKASLPQVNPTGFVPSPGGAIRFTPQVYGSVDPIGGPIINLRDAASDVQYALRRDPLFSDLPVPLFKVAPPSPEGLDARTRTHFRMGRGVVPNNIWEALIGTERAGVLIPLNLQRELGEKYGRSFLIAPEEGLRVSSLSSRLMSQIDELGQWDLAAETLGRPALYTPRFGVLDPAARGLHPVYGESLSADDVADALRRRIDQYVETNNAIVYDSILEDLLSSGMQIPYGLELGFNVRHIENLASLMQNSSIQNVIALPSELLDDLLGSGMFFNQFMTLSSRGSLSPKHRIISELSTNGISPAAGPLSRPVYGYAGIDDYLRYNEFIDSLDDVGRRALDVQVTSSGRKNSILQVGRGNANSYGDVHFVFSPESSSRSAFTLGDSLAAQRVAAPLQKPSSGQLALSGQNFGVGAEPYIETQTIAPQFKDLESVRILRDMTRSNLADVKAKLRSLVGKDVPVIADPYYNRPMERYGS